MSLPSHARLIPGSPPEQLDGVIFSTSFLQIARDAALIRLPDGSRLHWSRAADGVQYTLPAGEDAQVLEPILHQTVFAIVAWLDGLVPLPWPGILSGDELLVLQADDTDQACALTALLAAALGPGSKVTDTMVALSRNGTARLSGSALSAREGMAQAWLPGVATTPTARKMTSRVWLQLDRAPASAQPNAVTIISAVYGAAAPFATPQDTRHCADFLGQVAMLPLLGLALHGEAGLRDLLERIAAAVVLLLISGDHPARKPDALAELLAGGMRSA